MHVCPRSGCGAAFPRPYRLAAHLLLHDNKKQFKCIHESCGREYTSNSHLIRHYTTAHKVKEKVCVFPCPNCLKTYSNRQNLKRHIKIDHIVGVPYRCDECQKGFTKKYKLTAHMYKHTGVKGFWCELCLKSFVTLNEKKKHMRFHKAYICDECNEMFPRWSKLQVHKKNVHSIKEFTCHHCNRTFKARQHILRHMKMHNEDNRDCFVCPKTKCHKFYSKLYNLKHHLETAHDNKTFDCAVCDAKLSTKAKLQRHTETHNTESPKKPKQKKTNVMRKKRKDKGIHKGSIAAKLAGIKLPAKCIPDSQVEESVELSLKA